jgi:type VI secretion system protein ImpG
MKAELVDLYSDELDSLRNKGEQFAAAYPKIASRLKLGQGNVEDPTVGCLLESFAFLTSQVRYDLQSQQELLSENALQLLYPHHFLPIPVYSTVELLPNDQLESSYKIASKTAFEAPLTERSNITFTTCFDVDVLPITIAACHYERASDVSLQKKSEKPIRSTLSLEIHTTNGQKFTTIEMDSLRLFINTSSDKAGLWLTEFFSQLQRISIEVENEQVSTISLDQLKKVGFNSDEAMLPYPDNSFTGYQLLTEYFAYPEKFHYIDLKGLKILTASDSDKATINFYFDRYQPELEKSIEKDLFKVNCTPIINLFEQSAEPISLDDSLREYHVIADAQALPQHLEIYTITAMNISSSRYKDSIDCAPYYGRQFTQTSNHYLYWHSIRHSCASLGEYKLAGDEVFVSFQDVTLEGIEEKLLITPKVYCTNRNAPEQLPYGGGEPRLSFRDGHQDMIAKVNCIRPISAIHYRATQQNHRAELAAHIAMNQTGLSDPALALKNIRQCLALYAFSDRFSDEVIEQGIVDVNVKAVTERHQAALRQGFCRGIEYQVTVNDMALPIAQQYLLGQVLHQFLTQSCSINTFVRLTFISQQRGNVHTWKPQFGKNNVL